MRAPTKSGVTVYGRNTCPYCVDCTKMLTRRRVPYAYVKTTDHSDAAVAAFRKRHAGGYQYVPMVFVDGEFIGGLCELKRHSVCKKKASTKRRPSVKRKPKRKPSVKRKSSAKRKVSAKRKPSCEGGKVHVGPRGGRFRYVTTKNGRRRKQYVNSS